MTLTRAEDLRELERALAALLPGRSKCDAQGRHEWVNDAYAETLGRAPDELLSLGWDAALQPEERGAAQRAYERMRAEGHAEFETRLVRDGTTVHVTMLLVRREEERRRFAGHEVFLRDVTPQRAAALERERLAAQVEASCDAIIRLELDGTIASWNRGAHDVFGYEAHEILGRPVFKLLPALRNRDVLAGVSKGETIRTRILDGVARNGRRMRVSWSAAPVRSTPERSGERDASGRGERVDAIVTVSRDVTERLQMEERFREAVESSPSAMVMIDEEGRILLVNVKAEELFGYSREELLGSTVDRLVPERFRGDHPQHRRGYFAEPRKRALNAGRELYGLRKDGSEFPLEIGLNPIRTSDGMLVLSSIVDVSERKQAEERFRLAVESSPSAMVMVDTEGRIILVNAKTEELFGYGREELIGEQVEKLVPERFREAHPGYRHGFFDAPHARAMGAGRDLFGLHKNGTEFPVEIGLNPIRTSHGMFVLSAIVDITERKGAEERLRSTAEELTRSNADLEQFAYASSHDLQEPLRMIAGFLQLFEKRYASGLPSQAREYLGYAVEGSLRMRSLIEDLLAYSRVQTRDRKLQPVELAEALRDALANLFVAIGESRAEVQVGSLPRVEADSVQMTILFQNLIGNAIKFRSEKPPVISVAAQQVGAFWKITVADNGIGIDPRFAQRIFGLFQRLHPREQYPGTGIGLAICRRIVERHGGVIQVESKPEEGACFVFTLPRRKRS